MKYVSDQRGLELRLFVAISLLFLSSGSLHGAEAATPSLPTPAYWVDGAHAFTNALRCPTYGSDEDGIITVPCRPASPSPAKSRTLPPRRTHKP